MAQVLNLKCKGLITNPNSLDPEVVNGALSYADNIVLGKDDSAESRRGFTKYQNYLDLTSYENNINSMWNFDENIFVHYNDKIASDTGASSTWSEYAGTYDEPDTGYRIRAVELNKNLYITTADGIHKLSNTTTAFEDAGIVRALDGFGTESGTTGWMTTNTTVAYRMVWTKKDDNNNLIVSAPSSRLVVSNSSGTASTVSLTFLIPSGITTDYFYQIYRSNLTESSTAEPNDELQLVIQGKPTAGQITALEFTVTDDVSDDLKGATLYTSPSQQGIGNANEPPPFCKDMASFKNNAFYANTKTKHSLTLELIGVGTGALAVGDTFTIDGVEYTGAVAEDAASDEFLISTLGTPALKIDETALSIVRVVNKSTSTTGIYAYYLSGFDDIPGKIFFQRRTITGASFTAISSAGDAWTPELPSSGTNDDNTSDNEVKENRVYISKTQQPEAVPLLNYIDIGSGNDPIKRIIALRDSVFVFKDDGVYRITGESVNNFRVTLFDNNIKLLASESAVTFNNTVFCMTLQGVVSISDSGVAVVSRAIEQELLELIQFSNFDNSTFAISYESEREYILFCINSENQTFPTQAYVYNSFTNAWTRWSLLATCGFVNKGDDKLYFGAKRPGYNSDWVYQERKSFSTEDYVDDDFEVIIQSVDSTGTVLSLNRVTDAVVGYWIRQSFPNTGTSVLRQITSIDTDNITVTVASTSADWSTDTGNPVFIYKPIVCRVKWAANTVGNPGIIKHFREATLFFRQDVVADIEIGYETNFEPGYVSTSAVTLDSDSWGNFSCGTLPWDGLDDNYNQPIRIGIPRNKQRCLWISFSVEGGNAFSNFRLSGLSAVFEPVSERFQYNNPTG